MIGPEERAAVLEVLDSGVLSGFLGEKGDSFMGGPRVRACEAAFARRMGSKHALTFNSGTTALQAAVATVAGPGDEVIVPALTMSATAAAVLLNGAEPVFADVEDQTFGLDPASVAERITSRTKAIVAVHLFGHPCRMDDLSFGLPIIEDAAQSIGATYKGRVVGTIGHAGMLSLNRHKIIQCGEGGVLLTDDGYVAQRASLMRNHGEAVDTLVLGSNYRMNEIEAAIAIEQLKKLNRLLHARQAAAARLNEALGHSLMDVVTVAEGCTHVYWQYPLKVAERAKVAAALREAGIQCNEGYTMPLHLQRIYRHRFGKGFCPVAEWLWRYRLLLLDPFADPAKASAAILD